MESQRDAYIRDFNAVKRVAVAYMKLLFPHWRTVEDVDRDDFETFCLEPAIRRRGIVKEQCHRIDPEFSSSMPEITVAKYNCGVVENDLGL